MFTQQIILELHTRKQTTSRYSITPFRRLKLDMATHQPQNTNGPAQVEWYLRPVPKLRAHAAE